MKRNIFKLFLNKFLAYPIWVKQAVYYRLWQNMKDNNCDRYIINCPDSVLSLYNPTLTYQGKQELWDKKGGYDSNLHNFLKFSHNGYTLLEISLNMFMSIEEISKLFIFCLEQKLILQPESSEIMTTAEFIAGKLQTGEYLLKRGLIDSEQLEYALSEQKRLSDNGEHILLGNMLVRSGYLREETLKTIFRLKSDAKKRFVINPEMLPDSNSELKNVNKLEAEINALKAENQALKKTMSRIVNAVKNYDI